MRSSAHSRSGMSDHITGLFSHVDFNIRGSVSNGPHSLVHDLSFLSHTGDAVVQLHAISWASFLRHGGSSSSSWWFVGFSLFLDLVAGCKEMKNERRQIGMNESSCRVLKESASDCGGSRSDFCLPVIDW